MSNRFRNLCHFLFVDMSSWHNYVITQMVCQKSDIYVKMTHTYVKPCHILMSHLEIFCHPCLIILTQWHSWSTSHLTSIFGRDTINKPPWPPRTTQNTPLLPKNLEKNMLFPVLILIVAKGFKVRMDGTNTSDHLLSVRRLLSQSFNQRKYKVCWKLNHRDQWQDLL